MFGISMTELFVILAIALIVLGPDKLPELLYSAGKVMGKVQKELDELRREFYNSVYTPASDFQKRLDSAARNLVAMPAEEEKTSATKIMVETKKTEKKEDG